jgi:hypothetical protein
MAQAYDLRTGLALPVLVVAFFAPIGDDRPQSRDQSQTGDAHALVSRRDRQFAGLRGDHHGLLEQFRRERARQAAHDGRHRRRLPGLQGVLVDLAVAGDGRSVSRGRRGRRRGAINGHTDRHHEADDDEDQDDDDDLHRPASAIAGDHDRDERGSQTQYADHRQDDRQRPGPADPPGHRAAVVHEPLARSDPRGWRCRRPSPPKDCRNRSTR